MGDVSMDKVSWERYRDGVIGDVGEGIIEELPWERYHR